MTATKLKGRVMGARFKTFSGAVKRAQFEMAVEKDYIFEIEGETDTYRLANGFKFRIRKTKRA